MRPDYFSPGWLAVLLLAAAQLPGAQPDPLARIREAAKSTVEACSTTGETLCEKVAPKIIENAMGESPLAENLRRVAVEIAARKGDNPAGIISWAVSAFHDPGIDAQTEKYASVDGTSPNQKNVVAEIRGREKPDEWVLFGAHLYTTARAVAGANENCGAAMVIEAARDISRTGIHPRRSIRFVLFTGSEAGMAGSWAHVHSHRAELDRARASITFGSGCSRVTGYTLYGRHDLEPGVREAVKPAESLGAPQFFYWASMETDNYDFLVEGVPTLAAVQASTGHERHIPAPAGEPANIDIADIKRNTAIVAVTAFGIAERAESVGPRQSRAEIETLLKSTGLDEGMKDEGLWPLWQIGQRGRLP